jgi:hypothetical protein
MHLIGNQHHGENRVRKIVAFLAAGCAVAAMWLSPSSASADSAPLGNEACTPGAFCLYYNSPAYGWGSFAHLYDLGATKMSLGNVRFLNYGDGGGYYQRAWHTAAGYANNTGYIVWVCSSSQCFMALPGYSGALPSGVKNLDETIASNP